MLLVNPEASVSVSATHFELTPALCSFVAQRVERLFCGRDGEMRVQVELRCDHHRSCDPWFLSSGHIVTSEREVFASVGAEDCLASVSFLIDELDRLARR